MSTHRTRPIVIPLGILFRYGIGFLRQRHEVKELHVENLHME